MRIVDLIVKKRDGAAMTREEIFELVTAFTADTIPDYQFAAWLMAIYFRGMSADETAWLTMAMAESGVSVNLSRVPGVKVDKHSTGGVADTTTLIVAPLVAAAGIPVAKMSGRGLGHTGGTIDKLEAIPGFQTSLSQEDFISQLCRHNIAITGQSPEIAPADGKMYSLRDVTGTIESIPLIASSIMSKKIASGADRILLDVKTGSGAFMKSVDQAINLAEAMVRIGQLVNRKTVAVITSMDEPLGYAVGNALEVREAIEILSGSAGSERLKNVCLALSAYMHLMAGASQDYCGARARMEHLLKSGAALEKFREFVAAQGGNPECISRPGLLPQASITMEVKSEVSGLVQSIDAAEIGYCAMLLGAGREHKLQKIDHAAGIIMRCSTGDFVRNGETLAIIHTNNLQAAERTVGRIRQAVRVGEQSVEPGKILIGIVDTAGFQEIGQI